MEMVNSAPTTNGRSLSSSLPLERKLPLLILGVLAFVLALSLVISYYAIRRSTQIAAGDRLASLAQVVAQLFQQQTAARLTLMHRASSDTAILNALRHPERAPGRSVTRAVGNLVSRTDFNNPPPELWTRDGRPLGRLSLELPAEARAIRDRVRAQATEIDTGYVSKLYVTEGHTAYWIAVPVRQDDSLFGYVAQERRIATSPRVLQPLRTLTGGDMDFYFRNTSDNTWAQLSGEQVPPPPIAKPFGDSLQILTIPAKGEVLASSSTIAGTPFAITITQPMSSILARPLVTIRILSVIAIILTVVGGVIAWIISRQVARPLVELTGAAEAIAEGQYSRRVDAHGRDEVGRLGSAFNRMAEQVQAASYRSSEAVDQLTQAVATQQFLAEASRILAMSLSDQMLLADLARFCVPTIADYCSLHLADDDGTLRRVESAHYDPAKQDALRALANRYEYRIDGPGEVPGVVRSQQPLIMPRLDLASIKASARDAETVRLLDEISPRSFMCVPLIARGRPLGAIALTMTDSGRVFGPADLDLAMELARRTAVAIDNAMIYRRSLALRLEAEAASTAKSDFLAKMSHEIRTPINAMMGYAELIEMGISGPISPAQSKQLARIRASGEHLTSLVNEILDLAKIEAGRMGVEQTNSIAADAIEAALGMVRPQATAKSIELASYVEGDATIEYIGDPQRVQQILANLLSNAVKFTPAGGRVAVRCDVAKRDDTSDDEREHQWACIEVEDTGVGIAAHDIDRVFDAFVQVDDGYTRAHGGTGLGLTISRGLARKMGGDITVASVPGKGSRFTLWLPVAQFVHS
jgi:signal transduction histidine kinase